MLHGKLAGGSNDERTWSARRWHSCVEHALAQAAQAVEAGISGSFRASLSDTHDVAAAEGDGQRLRLPQLLWFLHK